MSRVSPTAGVVIGTVDVVLAALVYVLALAPFTPAILLTPVPPPTRASR